MMKRLKRLAQVLWARPDKLYLARSVDGRSIALPESAARRAGLLR